MVMKSVQRGAGVIRSVYQLGCGLDNWGAFLAGARHFSLLRGMQTGSEDHPASYLMGTRDPIPKRKTAGA
jgi:hypothetical protein